MRRDITAHELAAYATIHGAVQIVEMIREGYFTEEGETKALDRLHSMLGGDRDMLWDEAWGGG